MSQLDRGRGADVISLGGAALLRDRGGHRSFIRVEEFEADAERWARRQLGMVHRPDPVRGLPLAAYRKLKLRPSRVIEAEGNVVTDAGWQLLMKNAAGTAGTLFSATVGRIGLGSTAATPAYADTDLAAATGATTRQWQLISATPTVGSTHGAGLVFSATFGTGVANFHAQEWGTDQGTASGTGASVSVFFNHGASDLGTKTSALSWAVTITITWT